MLVPPPPEIPPGAAQLAATSAVATGADGIARTGNLVGLVQRPAFEIEVDDVVRLETQCIEDLALRRPARRHPPITAAGCQNRNGACLCGSNTITAVIRTRRSAIVHPASSSRVKPYPDRVRIIRGQFHV